MKTTTTMKTKEEKLTEEFNDLIGSIKDFIRQCPEFPNNTELVGKIGANIGKVESTLHWQFDCWELGLP